MSGASRAVIIDIYLSRKCESSEISTMHQGRLQRDLVLYDSASSRAKRHMRLDSTANQSIHEELVTTRDTVGLLNVS